MGKVTEILFSLVREAMGNERVTTCSPTAGGRHTDKEQGLEDPQTWPKPVNKTVMETGRSSGLLKVCVCIMSHPVGRWACPWRWAGRWWGRWRPQQGAEADLPSAPWPPRGRQGSGGPACLPSPAPHQAIASASAAWAAQRQGERRINDAAANGRFRLHCKVNVTTFHDRILAQFHIPDCFQIFFLFLSLSCKLDGGDTKSLHSIDSGYISLRRRQHFSKIFQTFCEFSLNKDSYFYTDSPEQFNNESGKQGVQSFLWSCQFVNFIRISDFAWNPLSSR